ncbi:hypothetical protein pb186bvf_010867 [Paramecium bursaria]
MSQSKRTPQNEDWRNPKPTRHFPNQVYKQDAQESKLIRDVDKVSELIQLSEMIKQELSKVKFCLQCKRKFSSMKYLIQHEESDVHKKVKL